ncbi:unnamed protein product [Gordionus sp. m RMFG-2023]
MLHWHVMIACVIMVQLSVTNYANVLPKVETIGTTSSNPPKNDVDIVYIGERTTTCRYYHRGICQTGFTITRAP